jgi:para-nitrobenzyl esterase
MKNITLSVLFLSLVSILNAQPCNGGRYASEIFSNFSLSSNIVYGQSTSFSGANTSLKLDFYQGMGDTETNRPLIIWVHGGSFLGGTKTDFDVQSLSKSFARKGYACASIDYRTGFFPIDSANAVKAVVRAVQDLKGAIRFFYKDVASGTNTYKIDTNHIYIGGSSAGAITSLHTAYLDDVCELSSYLTNAAITSLGSLEGNSGNPGYSTKTHGVINLCGALAKYSWLESGDQPLCSIHGTNDGTVKYNRGKVVASVVQLMYLDGSRMLYDRACAVNVQNNFYTFPGAPHVPYAGTSANAIAYMDTTDNFIRDFLIDQLGCTNSPLQLANTPLQTAILYPTSYCDGSPVDEICSGLGIESEYFKNEMSIYPNPTNGAFIIELEVANNYTLHLIDQMGRIVQKSEFSGTEFTVDINGLQPGHYYVKVNSTEENLPIKKLIVNL